MSTHGKVFAPPTVAGQDNVTGQDLVQRTDDTPNTVRRRLQNYYEETEPVVDYYRHKNLVEVVDAQPRDIGLVYRRLKAAISQKCPSLEQPPGKFELELLKLQEKCNLLI